MNLLAKKVILSELIIRHAVDKVKKQEVNVLWSGGKDSTVVLHIIKNMYGSIPFTVTFADCTYQFREVYGFVDRLTKEWNLQLDTLRYGSPDALRRFEESGRKNKKILSREKLKASREYVKARNIRVSISGIRWYEHFHRINRFHGKSNGVLMAYPILHWTRDDIWDYIRIHKVPYLPLYDQGYSHIDLEPFSLKDGFRAPV